jgi:transposase-like protein
MGWRTAGGLARKPTTEGPEGGAGTGCRGETGPRHRPRPHVGHSGFQEHNSARLPETKCRAWLIVYTDGLKSFTGLHEAGYKHVPRTQPLRIDLRKGAKSVVPLADRAIGNLQQWLIGTYHGVSREQLQVYLDEFVFRHNRRRLPMAAFQTLLGLGTGRKPTPYKEIRGAADLSKPTPNTLGLPETTG